MSMNIFRLCGDMSHLASKIILLLHLYRAKNARGISVKTQELYLLVFLLRYLDLFTTFYSIYNYTLKVLYIAISTATVCQIKYCDPIKSVYNKDQDSFPHWRFAVLPCFVLGLLMQLYYHLFRHYYLDLLEWLWTVSIILESIAIFPQLLVLRKYRLVENLTAKFMLCLGSYRALYILNWIYRSYTEKGYQHRWLVSICGVIQTLMYVDFFYQYFTFCCRKEKRDDGNAFGDDDHDGQQAQDAGEDEGLIFELPEQQNTDQRQRLASSFLLPSHTTEPLLDRTKPGSMDIL